MRRWTVGLVAIAPLWAAVADAQPLSTAAKVLPPPRFGHTRRHRTGVGPRDRHAARQEAVQSRVEDQNIPIGSLLDTTRGRVDLRAAPPPASTTGTARAAKVEDAGFKGKFTVSQRAGATVTEILLAGGNPIVCSESAYPASAERCPTGCCACWVPAGTGSSRHEGDTPLRRCAARSGRQPTTATTPVSVQRGVVSVQDFGEEYHRHRHRRPQLLRQGAVGRVSRAAQWREAERRQEAAVTEPGDRGRRRLPRA